MELLATSYLIVFFALAWTLIYLAYSIEQRWAQGRRGWQRLLVIVPRELRSSRLSALNEVAQSAELYKRLGEFRIPFTLETVVHGLGEEIHWYVLVPKFSAKKTARLIESLWPTAQVEPAQDYDLWPAEIPSSLSHLYGNHLTQAKPYCIPLKTHFKGHFEPSQAVLRHLSGLAAVGEGAAIQWVVRVADAHILQDVGEHLQKFHSGEYHPSRHIHERYILTPQTIKLLEEKVASPLFVVNCRIVATGVRGNAKNILNEVASAFTAGEADQTQYNHFELSTPRQHDRFLEAFLTGQFDPSQQMVLTADELATYCYLPGPSTAAPKIKRISE